MNDYFAEHPIGNFEEYLQGQMLQWDKEAEELTAALGLPMQTRYDVMAVIYDQVVTSEENVLPSSPKGLEQPSRRSLLPVRGEDSDPDPEEILEQYNSYIVALVGQMARSSSSLVRPEVFDLEVDEVAQQVRIKLWHALTEKHIKHHKAYIRTLVRNEFNDLSRKRKPPLSLLTNEDKAKVRYYNFAVPEGLYEAVDKLADERDTTFREALCHLVALGLTIDIIMQDPSVSLFMRDRNGEETRMTDGINNVINGINWSQKKA
jgi:DNA-directed RNA polymerase specialized sigma24 family protein